MTLWKQGSNLIGKVNLMYYYNKNITFMQSLKAGMLSDGYKDLLMMHETWKSNLMCMNISVPISDPEGSLLSPMARSTIPSIRFKLYV